MSLSSSVLLIGGAILILALLGFFRILRKPIKWALKLLLNAVLGFVLLFLVNLLGSHAGISLTINWVNIGFAGILGVPGVILLLIFKYIV